MRELVAIMTMEIGDLMSSIDSLKRTMSDSVEIIPNLMQNVKATEPH